ncbi:alpha/beta hydrolase fold domain-containing protein [Gordonia amarae]|uniref:Alpha/beta hydrolase fold domain-containing protein n=2 Tax=Gordonia amarae TaxID=36821 RepID=A0A857LSM6_9ACTN|nr:alpha/beta hydrolase fold domain-containing protein [Gordonia amarae]QHN41033.1 alpha/beta hydrolase fold domain-containing protein [Gordonia amarae]GAB04152.1 putative esterase [Gordonia amarae NBRC 15530]
MSYRCDVRFSSRPTGELLLDLYRPASASGAVPVIVWLHGGGWFTGDRTLAPDLQARADAIGAAIASIEYRLSGQALFPAQIIDLRAAIRYLREQAGELGVDPGRIGLWGSSAGGHLAALAGVTGHLTRWEGEDPSDTPVGVQAVMAAYPPVDLAMCVRDASAGRPEADPIGFPESRVLGGLPADLPELAASAGPLTYIDAARSLPPFQLAHGTADVAVRMGNSVRLYEALHAAGADAELYLLDGYKHGFLNPGGRMEAGLSAVMDDGRLEAAGTAPARHLRDGVDTDAALFGFTTIDEFFRTHLGLA